MTTISNPFWGWMELIVTGCTHISEGTVWSGGSVTSESPFSQTTVLGANNNESCAAHDNPIQKAGPFLY